MAGMKKRTGFSPWKPHYKLEKYSKGVGPDVAPDEVIEWDGNMMMNAGINAMLLLLVGTGGTDFDQNNGYLGVGNSSTPAANTQTDLIGTSTARVQITALATIALETLTFVASFGAAAGNFTWEEVGIFNGPSGGTMLTRSVSALGTKAAGATWVLTITLTIS